MTEELKQIKTNSKYNQIIIQPDLNGPDIGGPLPEIHKSFTVPLDQLSKELGGTAIRLPAPTSNNGLPHRQLEKIEKIMS